MNVNARENLLSLLLVLVGGIGTVAISWQIPHMDARMLAATIAFILVLLVSFLRGVAALYLIIFAILFSPEIATGMATGRTGGEGGGGIVIRLDDILILATAAGWMLRSKLFGRKYAIPHTPVAAAIWLYMGASLGATMLGVVAGNVRLEAGIMHNLKYFEYFLLFFMMLAHVRSREIFIHLLAAMLAAFFFSVLYGYFQMPEGGRIVAPFDTEPNTFGGYLVFMMCIAGGIAMMEVGGRLRNTMICLIALGVPPLLFTLSRASYMSAVAALVAFILLGRQRLLLALITMMFVCMMFLGIMLIPAKVQERVAYTFEPGSQYQVTVLGITFDPSTSARLVSYDQAVKRWYKRPVFGYGVTGTHFIDGQLVRILAEAGVVGLGTFLFIFIQLLRQAADQLKQSDDPLYRGLSLGFICGTIAMLAHAMSVNSFIIIRIAEPFWMVAGLVILSPLIEQNRFTGEDKPAPKLPEFEASVLPEQVPAQAPEQAP